uniref:Uncharacterized protein n=1 Tax=Rhizophora mucronata TaxID=61149 RepID=A0A2P2Q6W1_RHIMU
MKEMNCGVFDGLHLPLEAKKLQMLHLQSALHLAQLVGLLQSSITAFWTWAARNVSH